MSNRPFWHGCYFVVCIRILKQSIFVMKFMTKTVRNVPQNSYSVVFPSMEAPQNSYSVVCINIKDFRGQPGLKKNCNNSCYLNSL